MTKQETFLSGANHNRREMLQSAAATAGNHLDIATGTGMATLRGYLDERAQYGQHYQAEFAPNHYGQSEVPASAEVQQAAQAGEQQPYDNEFNGIINHNYAQPTVSASADVDQQARQSEQAAYDREFAGIANTYDQQAAPAQSTSESHGQFGHELAAYDDPSANESGTAFNSPFQHVSVNPELADHARSQFDDIYGSGQQG